MDFGKWLRIQKYRNDPVGDLARDAVEDKWQGKTADSLRKRMNVLGACSGAFDALKMAVRSYNKQIHPVVKRKVNHHGKNEVRI